ncbi:related to triacylglycerol lipase [Phialocephala subalpina]|uniref:Related to triacylglycerol lipase n=1 Tax=Phialocephala subalpina TaxID=576137 RepID=A0A1L7WEH3_9HELO|nr:related to triacylglycerol lipase [Phialocephala subalpina]
MRYSSILIGLIATSAASAHPSNIQALSEAPNLNHQFAEWNSNISIQLFAELEELARIVDISYCVGTTGISKPFECVSRCHDFPDFELVDTFNTGPLMSDSCGYVVLDHGTGRLGRGRIIVAFRGTYSIANTIVDLSTVPQEYVPYPDSPDNSSDPGQPILPSNGNHKSLWDYVPKPRKLKKLFGAQVEDTKKPEPLKCSNCTVHTGFWTSWQNTRTLILPYLKLMKEKYPDYRVDLVGHSLGGAVAALAGLELDAFGWEPVITTFGEPKIGNKGMRSYVDHTFKLPSEHDSTAKSPLHAGRYRRITHVDDPVPLLPLQEWGYRSHAGEIFISKESLQPTVSDIRLCFGDEDINCIAAAEVDESWFQNGAAEDAAEVYNAADGDMEFEAEEAEVSELSKRWGIPIPARYKIWQLFFAHRDYFWRLGLCVPGGDPLDWGRDRYRFGDEDGREEL